MSQRIVFLIDSFTGPWAGTERQLWYLLEGIDRHRFEPHLILLRDGRFFQSAKSWPCPVDVVGVGSLASLDGLRGLARLVRLVRSLDGRVVHAFFQDSSLLGPLAARLAGARFVAGRRDMGIWYTPTNLRLLRLVGRLVDRVIANSNAVRELVAAEEGISKSRISVIYNGLEQREGVEYDVAGLDDRVPKGAPVIGIVANLRPVKRHADLISAFARVRQDVPAAHLVIVGEGELQDRLRKLAASKGVTECTHFLGTVESPAKIIRRFTVAVLCSESEGLSNALMECLREGKPVVCTDVGGNPELVTDGKNGFLYPLGDEDMLVDRLVRLLKETALLKKLGAEAARSMAFLTVDNMVCSHMAAYDSILQASSPSSDFFKASRGREVVGKNRAKARCSEERDNS